MKKKDLSEFKTKAISDLKRKISDLKKQNVESLLQIKMGKTKNVHEAHNTRRDIARLNTLLKLKVLTQAFKKEDSDKTKEGAQDAAG